MSKFDTNKLEEEINSLVEALSETEAGSEEYQAITKDLAVLMDRMNEVNKLKLEGQAQAQRERQEIAVNVRECKKLEQDRKNQIIQHVINIAGIAVSAGLTIWGTKATIEFEKEGTVTTIFGREYFKKLFRIK